MLNPANIRAQIDALLLSYPELSEDETLRADCIEAETGAFEFLRYVERKRQETTALITGISANIITLQERQNRFYRREGAFRELIFKIMEAGDLHKAELPEATLSIRQGNAKVIITDETILPASFIRTKTEPDKKKIAEELKAGTLIAGAILSNPEPTLSIRTK